MAVGTTGGVAVMAIAHWPSVRRLPGKLRWRPDFRHPAVRKLADHIIPVPGAGHELFQGPLRPAAVGPRLRVDGRRRREVGLEHAHFRAENVLTMLQHTRDGLVDGDRKSITPKTPFLAEVNASTGKVASDQTFARNAARLTIREVLAYE